MQHLNYQELILQSELKNFGLNPYEWNLRKTHYQSFLIEHISDQEFYFYGQIEYKKQKPKWKFLSLLSL